VKSVEIPRTKNLIQLLGRHSLKGASEQQLTLYELGALVVVAGTEAGFEVHSEFSVALDIRNREGKLRKGKIDCAWIKRGVEPYMAVAWEIDGQDVQDPQLNGTIKKTDGSVDKIGNIRKFQASGALIKVQALYAIRGKVLKDRAKDVEACYGRKGVRVLSDATLMQGELFKIVEGALHNTRSDAK
jgi:hypothetical protein